MNCIVLKCGEPTNEDQGLIRQAQSKYGQLVGRWSLTGLKQRADNRVSYACCGLCVSGVFLLLFKACCVITPPDVPFFDSPMIKCTASCFGIPAIYFVFATACPQCSYEPAELQEMPYTVLEAEATRPNPDPRDIPEEEENGRL